MKKQIVIGKVRSNPGTKVSGFLTVAQAPVSNVEVPLMIINGMKDGPTLCLIAGTHGTEYPGIEAPIRLFKKIDPRELSGAVIIVPVVNPSGFQTRTPYINPIDGFNMGHVLRYSRARGSTSHLIMKTLLDEVVSKANFLMDLHGGEVTEGHLKVVYGPISGNKETDAKTKALVKYFPTKYVYIEKHTEDGMVHQACKKGIIAMTVEAGEKGEMKELDVAFHLNGILNIMRYLKMIPGTPKQTKQKYLGNRVVLRTKHGGLYYPKVECDDIVSEGQIVGEVKNVFGDVLETVSSPIDGVVIITYVSRVVNTGDKVIGICQVLESE